MTRKFLSVSAGFGVAALFTCMLVRGLDWGEVVATLQTAQMGLLIFALVLLAADYSTRILRWQTLLSFAGNEVSYTRAASPLLVGFAANNILPLRIGDILRIVMLRSSARTSLTNGIGTLLIERIWDLATLGAIFAATLHGSDSRSISEWAPTAVGMVCLGIAVLLCLALFANPIAGRLAEIEMGHSALQNGLRLGGRLCRVFADVSRPAHILRLSLHSFVIWGVEGLVLYVCALALHIDIPFQAVYFILSAANLSGLLPGTPGNVGTFHYFAVLAATSFGVNANQAAALALSFHALMWVPITLSGLACFITSSMGLRNISMISNSVRNEL